MENMHNSTMNTEQMYSPQEDPSKHNGKAIASLILGLVAILAWIIPFIGLPVTIVGLVLGILGRKAEKKGMAIAGIILNCIFMLVTIGYAIISVILIMGGYV